MKHTFIMVQDNEKTMEAMQETHIVYENSIENLNSYKVKIQVIESYSNRIITETTRQIIANREEIARLMKQFKEKEHDTQFCIKYDICGLFVYHDYSYLKFVPLGEDS